MKAILIFVIALLGFNSLSYGQEKTNVRFVLADAASGDMITDGSIVLKILSDHFGIGDEHPFSGGTCTIKYPVNRQLKYTIISDKYYIKMGFVQEYNVIQGNANTVTVLLSPANEKNLVIKGRVINKKRNELFGCKIQINMDADLGTQKAVTDSSGFFQIVIENGKRLIGTKYKLSIINPLYLPFDTTFAVENKTINSLGDLVLQTKANPPKVGYIKFKGPKDNIKSIILLSDSFVADELKSGMWRITSKTETLPPMVKFKINCKDCAIDTLTVAVNNIIGKTFNQDITPAVKYNEGDISFSAIGSYDMLLGANMEQGTAASVKLSVSKTFSIMNHWFQAELRIPLGNNTFSESATYKTLPGNTGKAINSFTLIALPVQLRYFFSSAVSKIPAWFVGINGGFYWQRFTNVSASQSVSEDLQHLSFFAPGINGGIRYNLAQILTLCGEISADYLKVSNINYQFNYFGHADQSRSTNNQIKMSINLSMICNL